MTKAEVIAIGKNQLGHDDGRVIIRSRSHSSARFGYQAKRFVFKGQLHYEFSCYAATLEELADRLHRAAVKNIDGGQHDVLAVNNPEVERAIYEDLEASDIDMEKQIAQDEARAWMQKKLDEGHPGLAFPVADVNDLVAWMAAYKTAKTDA